MSYAQVLHDVNRIQSMANYVTGKERPLYFKRPLVPTMNDVPVHLSQDPIQQSNLQQTLNAQQQEMVIESKTKDVEIQTMYRDGEAQTDPYTPKYILREGESPEILTIQHLKWGKGLPASIDELDAIEQNREKSWFENSLPPISDEASFHLRRKLMEEQEVREWTKKESEIKKQQSEKLYLLQSALIEREKDVEEKNSQRIEEIKIKKTEQKNRLIAKIQRRKIKVLRKMLKSRKEVDKDHHTRDIIEDYHNFASKVYAGITREGLSLDKIANKYEVQPIALTTFQGMNELSQTIPQQYMENKYNVKKLIKNIEKDYTRLENQHKVELKRAQDEIEGKNKQVEQQQVQELRRFSLSKMKVRPPTPTWKHDTEYNLQAVKFEGVDQFKINAGELQVQDKKRSAVLLLQRLIRGRAMQNIMYEGKEKRLALIEELLSVAKIQELPIEQQEEILQQNHEQRVLNSVLESIQGKFISQTIDHLSKELLRFKQERRIASMVQIAENDRRIKEIEEAGRRQADETLRAREDVLYNEIMRVHQTTVDSQLDWIMKNTLEKASARQAYIMAKLRKDKMDKPLESYERKFNNNETIIRDLMQSFLIPNVQRSKVQKQIELEEKRFNDSAQSSLITVSTKTTQQIKEINTQAKIDQEKKTKQQTEIQQKDSSQQK